MTPQHAPILAPDDGQRQPPAGQATDGYRLGEDFAELRQASIMMIDDEPITMEVVQAFLEEAGYKKFILLDDSTQGLDRVRAEQPDVLLLDVVMPEVTGFDILQWLRQDPEFQHLPVIILTSNSDASTKLRALDLGATDFLSKPVDPSELALRVRNTLAAKAYQDQLAYYDGVTGLPNRLLFQDRAQWAIDKCVRDGGEGALLHVAFEDFKRVTDAFGPKVGDEVLKQLAERLHGNIRTRDSLRGERATGRAWSELFRVGGADFYVLTPVIENATDSAVLGRRLLKAMQQPLDADGTEVCLTPSIGVVGFPGDADDVATLSRLAVGASSQAQKRGSSRLQFYSAEMNQASLNRLRIEADLRRAIDNREFHVLYQPKIDVANGEVVGTEALIRWRRADGFVSPAEFIPVAEETGLILQIGDWVLLEACEQVGRWNLMGIDTGVAVNISPRQFFDADLFQAVKNALATTGIDPSRLTLEVTESLVMDRIEQVSETLRRLRSLGVKVSIDDFGTGYSSLSYLKSLPADEVKIDRSFLQGVASSRPDQALVYAVTFLAHELGLRVCAEGVEDTEQLKFLKRIRCDVFQGFLYSRPVAPDGLSFQPHMDVPV